MQIDSVVRWVVQPSIRASPAICRFLIPGLIQFNAIGWGWYGLGVVLFQKCEGHRIGSNGGCQKMAVHVMKMMIILWNQGAIFNLRGQDGPNAGVRDCRHNVSPRRRDFASSRVTHVLGTKWIVGLKPCVVAY